MEILRQKVVALNLHLLDLIRLALAIKTLHAEGKLALCVGTGRFQFNNLFPVLGSNDNFLKASAHFEITHEF